MLLRFVMAKVRLMRMYSNHTVFRLYCIVGLIDYHDCAIIGINPKHESRISSNIPSLLYHWSSLPFIHCLMLLDLLVISFGMQWRNGQRADFLCQVSWVQIPSEIRILGASDMKLISTSRVLFWALQFPPSLQQLYNILDTAKKKEIQKYKNLKLISNFRS